MRIRSEFFHAPLRRVKSDRRGGVAVMMALLAPVLIGFFGLGVEFGFWMFRSNQLQNAADVAAFAAAAELRSGDGEAAMKSAASDAALESGFRSAKGELTVFNPPRPAGYDRRTAVEVELRETWPMFLLGAFLEGDQMIAASATAQFTEMGPACLLALDPTADGAATLSGSADVTLAGCNIVANSVSAQAVDIDGSADVETPCVSTPGGVSDNGGLVLTECSAPLENSYAAVDPYAGVEEPFVPESCDHKNARVNTNQSETLSPGRYCGGLTIQGAASFDPGVYIIEGGEFRVNAGALAAGDGVTFYIREGAEVRMNGGAHLDLSAPVSGEYSGLLFFGSRDNGGGHLFNGDADTLFTGAIYFPSASVELRGSNTMGEGCTQIIGRTVDISGNAGLGSDCSAAGISQVATPSIAKIVL